MGMYVHGACVEACWPFAWKTVVFFWPPPAAWLKACWSLGWKPVGHSDDADDNHDDDDDSHDDDDVDDDDDADDQVHAGLVWLLAP